MISSGGGNLLWELKFNACRGVVGVARSARSSASVMSSIPTCLWNFEFWGGQVTDVDSASRLPVLMSAAIV